MLGAQQPANLVAASLHHGNKPSGIEDFQHFTLRECVYRSLTIGTSRCVYVKEETTTHRNIKSSWIQQVIFTQMSLCMFLWNLVFRRDEPKLLIFGYCCQKCGVIFHLKGRNCKLQLLGFDSFRPQLVSGLCVSVRVCVCLCVSVCVCASVCVDVNALLTQWLVSIKTIYYNLSKFLKAAVMKYNVHQFIVLEKWSMQDYERKEREMIRCEIKV